LANGNGLENGRDTEYGTGVLDYGEFSKFIPKNIGAFTCCGATVLQFAVEVLVVR